MNSPGQRRTKGADQVRVSLTLSDVERLCEWNDGLVPLWLHRVRQEHKRTARLDPVRRLPGTPLVLGAHRTHDVIDRAHVVVENNEHVRVTVTSRGPAVLGRPVDRVVVEVERSAAGGLDQVVQALRWTIYSHLAKHRVLPCNEVPERDGASLLIRRQLPPAG